MFIDLGEVRKIRRTRRMIGRINGMLAGVNMPAVNDLNAAEITLHRRERDTLVNTLGKHTPEDIIENITRIAYLVRPE